MALVLAQDIAFTRSRPYKKNDQATVESKNNQVVRKHAFYWRYESLSELLALNRLWRLVHDRLNYLTPTRKPIGFGSERNGKQTRIYYSPATPMERLLTANVLSEAQKDELTAYRDSRGPAQIARDIAEIQRLLVKMAKEKTDQLYLAGIPSDLRDARTGIRVKAS